MNNQQYIKQMILRQTKFNASFPKSYTPKQFFNPQIIQGELFKLVNDLEIIIKSETINESDKKTKVKTLYDDFNKKVTLSKQRGELPFNYNILDFVKTVPQVYNYVSKNLDIGFKTQAEAQQATNILAEDLKNMTQNFQLNIGDEIGFNLLGQNINSTEHLVFFPIGIIT